MAYGVDENGVRHTRTRRCAWARAAPMPWLKGHRIRCSHFDAFRFFQPQAVERNGAAAHGAQARAHHGAAGCLHASMDLYKWA
ncbi:hypothetical protein QJS66_17010 [Kocuria rhizophila]|nr:hypothetical protein QJS66_17010 [Kocuria rhizophila]